MVPAGGGVRPLAPPPAPAGDAPRTAGQVMSGEVVALLVGEELGDQRWTVEVADGVVTPAGPDDPAARRLASLLAGTVPGVVAVRPGP
jgi:hypothetical protein